LQVPVSYGQSSRRKKTHVERCSLPYLSGHFKSSRTLATVLEMSGSEHAQGGPDPEAGRKRRRDEYKDGSSQGIRHVMPPKAQPLEPTFESLIETEVILETSLHPVPENGAVSSVPILEAPTMGTDETAQVKPRNASILEAEHSASDIDAFRVLTQSSLQNACKRVGQSSSGAKHILARHLLDTGVAGVATARSLAADFETTKQRLPQNARSAASREPVLPYTNTAGANPVIVDDSDGRENCREREPNWHRNETARLCHVVSDPRNAVALQKLYNKPETRAELDNGRHDPWTNEFQDLFNDELYCPDVPELSGGVMQEEIDLFDPCNVRHKRSGATLKRK
jgi:hypothetical protein